MVVEDNSYNLFLLLYFLWGELVLSQMGGEITDLMKATYSALEIPCSMT